MARRKSHAKKRHHTTRRRKHSMSGMGGTLKSAAYLIGGGVIAQFVGNMINKATATSTMSVGTKNLINGAVPIVAGVLTPRFIKGDVGAKLGAGMIAVGGVKILQGTGVLKGVGAMMNPYRNEPVRNIAGTQLASKGTYIAGVRNAAICETC
jgi:hypothetical protein